MSLPRLENWAYSIQFCSGKKDIWSITGEVYDHPGYADGTDIRISKVVDFDKLDMVVETKSGSLYELGRCRGSLAQQVEYILEDINE